MIFCQTDFFIFFIVVWIFTWITTNNLFRKILLLLSSYFFYGYCDWRFCLLLFLSSLLTYLFSYKIFRFQKFSKLRKIYLIVHIFIHLFILFIFKYYNFFIDSISSIFCINQPSWNTSKLILPIGISFYIFRCISYTIDIYRQKIHFYPPILDFFLYIAFFPCLIQGPIIRANSFLPQLQKAPFFSLTSMLWGIRIIVIGAFKKVFIADRIGYYVDEIFNYQFQYSSLTLVFASFAYTVQILCDFSGYSDIAVGTSKLLGYQVINNFDSPYMSTNISDFWRRWHISLSSWLRDYLYIPLGGSRKGKFRTSLNQMITMLLGGLWHGANWNYVVWGIWHGFCLSIHKEFRSYVKSLKSSLIGKTFSWFLTMISVVTGWIFFRATTIKDAYLFIHRILTNKSGYLWIEPFVLFSILILIVQNIIVNNKILRKKLKPRLGTIYYWWFIFTLICLIIIFKPTKTSPFIYFQF